jgi:hypothetical protein
MTREDKCKLAIEKGFNYNPETGIIINKFNKIITAKDKNGYIKIYIQNQNKRYQLYGHQFAWYCTYKEVINTIDHIDGNTSNNTIINLRSVTLNGNQWNRKTAKGYSFSNSRNEYQASIRINNKAIHLGWYKKECEAKQAYVQAKEKYHIMDNKIIQRN